MTRTSRLVAAAGGTRVVSALGGLFLAVGAVQSGLDLLADAGFTAALIDFLVIAVPGIVLLFGGYWLSESDVLTDLSDRVALWCLGGAGLMLAVVALLTINPAGDVSRPLRAAAIAAGLGAVGGFPIGTNEARALTRAREAEQHRDELRRERDLRERIVETSPVGIAIVEAEGTVRLANEHAARIVGIPQEELATLRYDEPMFREPGDATGSLFEHVLETESAVYGEERLIERPDGESVWLSVNGAPLRGPDGAVTAVIFAFEDISERKDLEAELKETVAKLEHSNDRLRQFAYAASHDLQEPLRMVSSYLQLLENRYADDLDDEARDFIDFAVDGAERMHQMVQDLLAYARVERVEPEFEPVDCDAVVDRVCEDLRARFDETDARLDVEPLPTVQGDEQQLEQLFQNLVSNALKYSEGRPQVSIGVEERDGEWLFSVADEGIGIDPERADRIFEVFKRLHHEDEYQGTGIGLALCQNVVETHDGDIWVESEPGEGSTFYFTLPRREADRTPAAA